MITDDFEILALSSCLNLNNNLEVIGIKLSLIGNRNILDKNPVIVNKGWGKFLIVRLPILTPFFPYDECETVRTVTSYVDARYFTR
jgi:hypothetical protein